MSFIKNLWIDTDNRQLVKGFLENSSESTIKFTQGDVVPLRVYLLKQTNNQGLPFSNIDITTESLRAAVGRVDQATTGGTFTLTFDGDTTSSLAYNISSTDLGTALNALTSVTTAGGVTVTGDGPYTISFDTVGAQTSITGDVTTITPISDMINIEKIVGDGSTKEVQVIKIKESPIALQETFTAIAAPDIDITEIIAGGSGINEQQKIKIDQECRTGSMSIGFDGSSVSIAYGATAAVFQAALETLSTIGSGNIEVQKISDQEYDVTFIGDEAATNQTLMTYDAAGLIGFKGFYANLDLSSYAVEELLNGADDADGLFFEIELSFSGEKTTLLRIPATVLNDVIDDAVTSPPSNGTDWATLLDAKAALSHSHAISDVTGLQTALDGKLGEDAEISDQTGSAYTLAAAEKSKLIQISHDVTVPVLSAGFQFVVVNMDSSAHDFTVSGTTLYGNSSNITLAADGGLAYLTYLTTSQVLLKGDVS